jgi:quercetin dioxygenase-like cupin family protein
MAFSGTAGTAEATPGRGVTTVTLKEWSEGGKDYLLQRITIEPGGFGGWHYHSGTGKGVMERGTLTHYADDCSVDGVYKKGDNVVEPGGPDNVHTGQNLGTEPVVLRVVFELPAGAPTSVDAPDPGCGIS